VNIPGYLALKNRMHVAAWAWRWHLQGGGRHWAARDLQDLRNEEDLRHHQAIVFRVWRARRELLNRRFERSDARLPAFLRRQAE